MRLGSGNNQLRKKIQDYSYGLTDLIGRGFSSSVFSGINQKTRQQVAIKVIDLKSIRDNPAARTMLDGEIQALKKLNHINLLKCHDIYSTVNNYYIITEFCNEGDLENLLKKREKLGEQQAIPIFRDIINGFKFFAEAGFLHRDLKPANILLKDKVAKIADFGFAKKATTNPKQTVNVGSPLYMSPQALKKNIYTIKNDIWSLGVMLYEILHGRAPWASSTQKELIEKISKQPLTFNKNISEDVRDFIRKCLTYDQSKRLGVNQLANHPFIVRITEEGGIPLLLKKQTSVQNDQFNSKKDVNQYETNHQVQNLHNQPHSIHHRKNPVTGNSSQRQCTAQINWMRFIYRFLDMFPPVQMSGRYTLGLRFISTKQMLSQLQSLKQSFHYDNQFNFSGWDQFLANEEKVHRYQKVLGEYTKKYESNIKNLETWVEYVKKDKRISCIADTNFARTENLVILGINFAAQECKQIWIELCKLIERGVQEEHMSAYSKLALRLDFTMTYYQLNCLLVDSFHDPDYFARNSKLQIIMEDKPAPLTPTNHQDLQNKLVALQLIKPN